MLSQKPNDKKATSDQIIILEHIYLSRELLDMLLKTRRDRLWQQRHKEKE